MNGAGILADLVLAVHAGVVIFVVLGQVLVMVGGMSGWPWVRNLTLRVSHLILMLFVAAQSWLGATCPLTSLERALRQSAGQQTHDQSFIGYWLSKLIFYQAPGWVFVTVYTAFALLVLASWFFWPPRRPLASEAVR